MNLHPDRRAVRVVKSSGQDTQGICLNSKKQNKVSEIDVSIYIHYNVHTSTCPPLLDVSKQQQHALVFYRLHFRMARATGRCPSSSTEQGTRSLTFLL